MRTILAYGLLAIGIVFAATRLQPPTPLPADAGPAQFSAARAFPDIRAIAQRPHPVGTADHDRVRDYLVGRLAQMGLSPSVRPGQGVWSSTPGRVFAAAVTNVAGVLPGKDRNKPALLIMAHYDTVPNSPGAADNTAGVAATLEIVRALKAGPPPARDVIILFPDGEELGMLGAVAFFNSDPLARRVGSVINFDARGDSGLANMFETGPNNSAAIAAYANAVPRPAANSLARWIYRLMPNGTDFTIPLRRGLTGFNFAFIGDEAAYHTPLSTPEHLNLGTVQHMGDQALAAARIFAGSPPPQTSDGVYADMVGLFMIQYSFAVGWVLFTLAALLVFYAVWRAHSETVMGWGRGIGGAVLLLVFPAQLLWTAGRVLGVIDHFERLAHFDYLQGGAVCLAIGAAALIVCAVEQGRGRYLVIGASLLALLANQLSSLDMIGAGLAVACMLLAFVAIRESRHPAALWPSLLLLVLLLALAAQTLAPEAAFALVWPLLLAGAVATLRVSLPRGAWQGGLVAMLTAVLASAFAAYTGAMFFLAIGVDLPVVLMLPLLMLLPVFLLVPGNDRLPPAAHAGLILAGIALFAIGRWAPPSETRPQPSGVRYVYDLSHAGAYRVASFAPLDAWERSALETEHTIAKSAPLPWTDGEPLWWSVAKPVAVPPSALDIRRTENRVTLLATLGPDAYSVLLELRPDVPVTKLWLNEEPLKVALKANVWNEVRVYVPGGPIRLAFDAGAHGRLDARLYTTYMSWPKDAPPLPPMPKDRMAFGTSGGTQTVLMRSQRW